MKKARLNIRKLIPWRNPAVSSFPLLQKNSWPHCIPQVVTWTRLLDRHWCRNSLGLNQLLSYPNLSRDLIFLQLCSLDLFYSITCSIRRSEHISPAAGISLTHTPACFNREIERDWDKELADEVAGECGDKYGPVVGIKVEKESQVCPFLPLQPRSLIVPLRVKFTSNSTPSNQPKELSKVSMVATLAEGASRLLSSPMPCFRPISSQRRRTGSLTHGQHSLLNQFNIFLQTNHIISYALPLKIFLFWVSSYLKTLWYCAGLNHPRMDWSMDFEHNAQRQV